MTDRPDPDDLPDPEIEPARTRSLSLAWLVPLLAVAIAGAIAWQHLNSLGPEVRIVLSQASGIAPGKTEVRYRDVAVGQVEALELATELDRVEAVVRMDASVEDRLTEGTTFWVVSPQISASGISGLETLVSGSYLGVEFGPADAEAADEFEALPSPPLTPPGTPGQRLTLVSETGGSLGPGSPVYFKSVEVGRVETKRLAEGSRVIEFDVFVRAPYHEMIGAATRFWDSSGIELSLGTSGIELDMGSLATILRGGAQFDSIGVGGASGAEARESGTFTLYASRKEAEESLFDEDPTQQVRFTARFSNSVRGLSVGAPVELRGVTVGEVEDLTVESGASIDEITVLATLVLQPQRLGLDPSDDEGVLAFFERSVDAGLRAQLAASNIVTGALYVELAELPEAGDAELVTDAEPYPRLPSAPSDLDQIRGTFQDLLARVAALPLEDTLGAVNGVLYNLETLTGNEELQGLPARLDALAGSAQTIVAELEQAEIGEQLTAAAASAGKAAGSFEAAAADLPGLLRRLQGAAASAEQVLDAYGSSSTLNTEAVAALREVRTAARAVSSLAQTLERKPNSLIIGR